MSAREILLRKILSMKAAAAAAATRQVKTALAAAPAAPHPPAEPFSSAQAQPAAPPAKPPAQVISLRNAAMKAGYYIAGNRSQSIDSEFPPEPVTSHWRATLDQTPRQFSPDTVDATCGDAVDRAYAAQQVRVAKETKS